jgi:hypothetical protein
MNTSLKVGWSQKDITPQGKKVSLAGQFYERLTTEVDYELKVIALAMHSGNTRATWVSCDLVNISAILNEDVREAVRKKNSEINSSNVFISAIHTHTAPYFKTSSLPGLESRFTPSENVLTPEEYHELLVDEISNAVVEANTKMVEGCTVQTGVSPTVTGCCRRGIINTGEAVMYIDTSREDFVRMEGPDGGPINIMYFRDKSGNLLGTVVSAPCTAQVLEHQFYMSSDYVGRVREMLTNTYGSDFFYLPLISAAGDLSPRNLVTKDYGYGNMYDKDGADNMAKRVFNAIIAEENRPVETITDFSDFNVAIERINLPGWVPTEEEYKWALSIKDSDEIKYDITDYVQKGVEPYFRTPLAKEKVAKTIIARYEHKEAYDKIDMEICAVRFGDTVWVSNPFELYQEFADRMIAGSKARSFWSIQLTTDALGYFPTKEAADAGGYSGIISSTRVDPGPAGETLVKKSIALADSLFT